MFGQFSGFAKKTRPVTRAGTVSPTSTTTSREGNHPEAAVRQVTVPCCHLMRTKLTEISHIRRRRSRRSWPAGLMPPPPLALDQWRPQPTEVEHRSLASSMPISWLIRTARRSGNFIVGPTCCLVDLS
ncbi:hypothetical protein LSAT2_001538 [Lamellibrachia satsuma]|nr:hypothetical protein LSAT2_001538 [Lamellibrachia satsuma]